MADFNFWIFGTIAVALGFKHAFDVDHVVAISNLLTRQPRLTRTLSLSSSWAAGHLLTASIVSAIVYFFADTFLPNLASRLELLVPIMLLAIGVLGLAAEYRRFHFHKHAHERGGRTHRHFHTHFQNPKHEHGAMMGIGVVHGLASNDELLTVLIVGLAASTWWQLFAGVALFSLGVLVGMMLYVTGVHAASQRWRADWVPQALTVAFSLLSIGYAVYLLVGGEGLNLVEGFLERF